MIYNPTSFSIQHAHWCFHNFWFSDQVLKKNTAPEFKRKSEWVAFFVTSAKPWERKHWKLRAAEEEPGSAGVTGATGRPLTLANYLSQTRHWEKLKRSQDKKNWVKAWVKKRGKWPGQRWRSSDRQAAEQRPAPRPRGERLSAAIPKPGLTLYSSSHTCASRRELCVIVSWPSGDPYGRLFRKMCPTLEQGMMNSLPPHIQIWSEAEHMLIVPMVLRGQHMAFMRLTSTKQVYHFIKNSKRRS